MADQEQLKEEFDQSVHQDRAAQIRQAARIQGGDIEDIKNIYRESKEGGIKGRAKQVLKEQIQKTLDAERRKITSFIVKRYVGRWLKGLASAGFIPIAGFIPAMTALFWWFIIKIANVRIKRVKVNVGMFTTLYVWLAASVQFLTISALFIILALVIYILLNPSVLI